MNRIFYSDLDSFIVIAIAFAIAITFASPPEIRTRPKRPRERRSSNNF
jgi:hypothetical protein